MKSSSNGRLNDQDLTIQSAKSFINREREILMKKKVIKVLMIFVCICLIGTIVLFIREHLPKSMDFDEINTVANKGNAAQGDYLLLSRYNGIKTFPLVLGWGDGLYLYSIKKDAFYLIKTCKIPFQFFDGIYTIQNNHIYYTRGMANPGQEIYMKDIRSWEGEKVIAEAVEPYVATAKDFYYLKIDWVKDHGKIFKKEIDSGKEQLVGEGHIEFMTADEENLYYYDIDQKIVFQMSIDTKIVTKYQEILSSPVWIEAALDNKLIIVNELNQVIELDKRSHKQRVITKLHVEESDFIEYKLANHYLYYNNEQDQFYRVNMSNGTQEKIIDLPSIDKMNQYRNAQEEDRYFDMKVHYCLDYIAIEVEGSDDSGLFPTSFKKLLIFDYDGKLVREKKM